MEFHITSKGKDESSNRFVNWIKAFDYKVINETELIYIIENDITNLFFQLISRRYEQKSTIITTNKSLYNRMRYLAIQ